MTNQEKDLKNAREYLDKELPELKHDDYTIYGHEELNYPTGGYCIDELLANHVQWLEQKGIVKFTDNIFIIDEKDGLIRCKNCDSLNCKNNYSCIDCGSHDYK